MCCAASAAQTYRTVHSSAHTANSLGFLPQIARPLYPCHRRGSQSHSRSRRDGNTDFFRAANIEILGNGQTLLTLLGVPDPESFRHAILDTRNAWVPGKAKMSMHFMAASAAK